MIPNIAILSAIFIAQVLALNPGHLLYKRKTATDASNYFDNALTEINALRELLSMAALDAYVKDDNIPEVLQCIMATKDSFEALGDKIGKKIRAFLKELKNSKDPLIKKYSKIFEPSLNYAAEVFEKLPRRIFKYIIDGEYMRAYETFTNSAMALIYSTRPFNEAMHELAYQDNQVFKKMTEEMENIVKTTIRDAKAVRELFIQCIRELRTK